MIGIVAELLSIILRYSSDTLLKRHEKTQDVLLPKSANAIRIVFAALLALANSVWTWRSGGMPSFWATLSIIFASRLFGFQEDELINLASRCDGELQGIAIISFCVGTFLKTLIFLNASHYFQTGHLFRSHHVPCLFTTPLVDYSSLRA